MKQKNNITLLVIGVLTLLVVIVGAAYAYFSSSITPGSGLDLNVEAQANTAQFTASGGQFGFTVTGAEMQQANAGSIAKEATGSINVSLTSPKIAMCTFDVAFAWNSGSSYTATSGRGSQFEFGVLYEGNPYGAVNNAIKPINFDTLISNGGKVLEDAKIIINEANGTSKTTNITLNFKVQMYNLNHDQSSLAGSSSKTYSGRFYVTNVDCQENKLYLNDVILASNEIYPDNVASTYVSSPAGINFGEVSSDTNGKGVYYTNQNTENNNYTYYFRGNIQNNYVKFGEHTVNQSSSCTYNGQPVYYTPTGGAVAMGSNPTTNKTECQSTGICQAPAIWGNRYVVGATQEQCESAAGIYGTWIGDLATWDEGVTTTSQLLWRIVRINEDGSIRLILEESLNSVVYNGSSDGGYMYGGTVTDPTNVSNSDIKNYLDTWYSNNLSSEYTQYLTAPGFCNDRELYSSTIPYYTLAYNRVYTNKSPIFKCNNTSRDLFTTSNSSIGNKALTYPIGLITVDEVVYAGYVYGVTISSNYLMNGTSFWTGTPYMYGPPAFSFIIGGDTAVSSSNGGSKVNSIGYYASTDSANSITARPVINLGSDIKIISGIGTETNPYIINLN